MLHTISVLMMALITTTAVAEQRWTVIGTNPKMIAQIDANSIKRLSDGGVQVWTRIKYRNMQISAAGREFDQIDRLSVYNCEEKTRRPVQIIMYKGAEAVDAQRVGDEELDIPPQSFAEVTLKWACATPVAKR